MKKLISIVLAVTIVSVMLSACGGNKLPSGLNGSDAAKLLLANERLNAQLLSNDGDIFENGKEVMENLASVAKTNLETVTLVKTEDASAMLQPLSTTYSGDYNGKVVVDGNTYSWSGFEKNNNSYDYFENITDNVVFFAEKGAELIDSVKKYVRVVDKWVMMDQGEYFLHVEENMEILISRFNDQIEICKRIKNADGDDEYELYIGGEDATQRMTYVPNKKYEMSILNQGMEDYFTADKSKGYWETYIVGAMPDHYNVSCFIMMDDICYDCYYDPASQNVALLKIMSSDRAADLIFFSEGDGYSDVTIHAGGFNGIKNISLTSSSVSTDTSGSTDADIYRLEDENGQYFSIASGDNAVINLTNGKSFKGGDEFYDGKIVVSGANAAIFFPFGYTGSFSLSIYGDSRSERNDVLVQFLNEMGITCKYSFSSVLSGIDRAYEELKSFNAYHSWNGVNVKTESGIAKAIEAEMERFDSIKACYTEVKDYEVIDFNIKEQMELNINFAPIVSESSSASSVNSVVTVHSAELSIEDTTLYVTDEPYTVGFALVSVDGGGLTHLTVSGADTTSFADAKPFSVGVSEVSFSLPMLEEGQYTLVAYISTADGIRASKYVSVKMETVGEYETISGNVKLALSKSQEGTLLATYSKSDDAYIELSSEALSYSDFSTLVSTEVQKYGTPADAIIEKCAQDGTYSAMTGNEATVESGQYRLAYSVANGEESTQGYVYITYTVQ